MNIKKMLEVNKYWHLGRIISLIGKFPEGEDDMLAVERGEKRIILENIIHKLFDRNGRRIPENLQAKVCDPATSFCLTQPMIGSESALSKRLSKLYRHFGYDFGVTVEQFTKKIAQLLEEIANDPQIRNILNGIFLPIILSKMTADNIGRTLEQYLAAVGNSYEETFSDRKFKNYRKDTLAGEVKIADGSRYGQLVKQLKTGPVPALYFPNSLQGFSVEASREQMTSLPERFVLSSLDVVIAMIMYPDVLAVKHYTPGLDLAAFSWWSASQSLCFRAFDDGLDFCDVDGLGCACGGCSGGLLFLG